MRKVTDDVQSWKLMGIGACRHRYRRHGDGRYARLT
ncbi:DUF1515 family protein [Rhizobium mongolense]